MMTNDFMVPNFKPMINRAFGLEPIKVGDQMMLKLKGIGIFAATVHKIVGNKALIICNDCVDLRPMNADSINEGGYENSDLKKWIDNDLFNAFPDCLKDRMSGLSIPSVGEIFGWDNEWYNQVFVKDEDERLSLMYMDEFVFGAFEGEPSCYWLRNSAKSPSYASRVNYNGYPDWSVKSDVYIGVRPEFWLEINQIDS